MKKSKMLAYYKKAKEAKVGEMISCPACGNNFLKNQYNTTFCSRTCKDKYWNTVDPNKRCRKNNYYYNVILARKQQNMYDRLPYYIRQNIDETSFEEFVRKNNLQKLNIEEAYKKYHQKIVKENYARMKGFSSTREMEQSYADESLGDEGESFGCTLDICEFCGKRVDVCECEQYWDNY